MSADKIEIALLQQFATTSLLGSTQCNPYGLYSNLSRRGSDLDRVINYAAIVPTRGMLTRVEQHRTPTEPRLQKKRPVFWDVYQARIVICHNVFL